MRLFRFLPRAFASWLGLAASLGVMLRLAWLPMGVSLAAGSLSKQWPLLTDIADQIAAAVFTVAWLRFAALGELPQGWLQFRLGRRELFFTLFWLAAKVFVSFPGAELATSLSLVTGIEPAYCAVPLLTLSHALLGVFYLLPVEAALEDGGRPRHPVPDVLMQGGLAVGIGLLPVWGPPAAALAALGTLDTASPLAAKALVLLPQYVGAAAVAGYLGLVWRALLADEAR